MKGALLFWIFLFQGLLFAQTASTNYSNEFKGLNSQGSIPADFLKSWSDKYKERLQSTDKSGMKRSDESELEEFWQKSHHSLDALLQSGRFSFGDPLSQYLNDISDIVLESDPELRKEIRVYLHKEPDVNAFSVADGIVALNAGLVAHAKSEAELAYIIGHEVAHVVREHLYDSFKQRKALDDQGGWFSDDLNPIAKFDKLIGRSKEHELDADDYGYQIFEKTNYHPAAVDSAFTTLHESYITYGRVAVGPDFLGDENFSIPQIFFREEVTPISKEEDYFDETKTHPNISSRRAALRGNIDQANKTGKQFFILGEERFHEMQRLARIEVLREKILYRQYANALYDIYVLRQSMPESKFLDVAQARCLYGLATFKAVDGISYVMASTSEKEGPSQQVNHLLRQLNMEQMVSLALYHVRKAEKKYPDVGILSNYSDRLALYLKAYCELEPDEFKVETSQIPPFSQVLADFPSERHYYRAQQRYFEDFHKYLLKEEFESGWLPKNMNLHQAYQDSLQAEKYMSVDAREERKEAKEDRLEEEGTNLNIRKMIVLNPTLNVWAESDDVDALLEALEKEDEFKRNLPTMMKTIGIEPILLYVEDMSDTDTEKYNLFANLEEWTNEARLYGRIKMQPTNLDVGEKLDLPTRYICRIKGLIKDGTDYYYFDVYDTRKGKVVYSRTESVGRNLSMRDLEKETQEDLSKIYN